MHGLTTGSAPVSRANDHLYLLRFSPLGSFRRSAKMPRPCRWVKRCPSSLAETSQFASRTCAHRTSAWLAAFPSHDVKQPSTQHLVPAAHSRPGLETFST